MLTAGSMIGAYRIEERLGAGAMGEVYQAIDTRLDRIVALKLIRKEFADSAAYKERLAVEARAAAKIDSPHVVRIWEYSIHDGTPLIAMEYVAGASLLEAVAGLGHEEKLAIALEIAEGIRAAHNEGLVHRDLKPDNISLTPDKCVKIYDFGLAKDIRRDSVDEQGNVAGTLHYLAPEQLMGEQVSFGADQFAFGVILYELFAGRLPFEGDYPASIIYSILHEEPVPPKETAPDLPDWLNHLILKLLSKRAADRFPDMATVAGHLRAGEATPIDGLVTSRRKNVTVVDLRNLSSDREWDYFCEGFTEDVINELSRRTALIVSAQPSQEMPRDIHEVFKRCRSDFVVSGSLRRWQEGIRLNLLIYGENGDRLISSEQYEDTAERLFDLLAAAVRSTASILASVSGQPVIEIDEGIKTDISAYDYYLKGKSYYQTNKPEDLVFAVKLFQSALEIDADFALAHSGIADVFVFQYMAYYDRTPARMDAARQRAQQAIDIEPTLPEAWRSLGRYHMFSGEFDLAEKCFSKAVELNPKYAVGYRTLAWLKYQQSDYEASMTWAKKSLQLAPIDTETLLLIALLHTYGRKYTAAMATLQRATEISPDYGRAYYNLGMVYVKLGVLDLALENFRLACKYQGDPNCYVHAGYIYLVRGDHYRARATFKKSIESGLMAFIAYYNLGFLAKQLGNDEEAQACFEITLKELKDVDFSDPENVQIQGFYAMAQAGAGQVEAAHKTLGDILAREHLIGDVFHNVARCYALLGDRDSAARYLEEAQKVPPGPTEKEIAFDPHFAYMTE